jgi:hypothetical protein
MSSTEQTIAMAVSLIQRLAVEATDLVRESNLTTGLTRVIAQRSDETGNAEAAAELAFAMIMVAGLRSRPTGLYLEVETDGANLAREKAGQKSVRRFKRRLTEV